MNYDKIIDPGYINDKLLQKTVAEVVQHLPQATQQWLGTVVYSIIANNLQDRQLESDGIAGSTSCQDEVYPEALKYRIVLWRGINTEGVRRYVVAHELAHACLLHPTLILRLTKNSGDGAIYTPLNEENLSSIVEDQANLQVCLWGFAEELVAFYTAYPKLRRPPFLQDFAR